MILQGGPEGQAGSVGLSFYCTGFLRLLSSRFLCIPLPCPHCHEMHSHGCHASCVTALSRAARDSSWPRDQSRGAAGLVKRTSALAVAVQVQSRELKATEDIHGCGHVKCEGFGHVMTDAVRLISSLVCRTAQQSWWPEQPQ